VDSAASVDSKAAHKPLGQASLAPSIHQPLLRQKPLAHV
jgi:hypothetical protein